MRFAQYDADRACGCVFYSHLRFVQPVWNMMAFGDEVASLIRMRLREHASVREDRRRCAAGVAKLRTVSPPLLLDILLTHYPIHRPGH